MDDLIYIPDHNSKFLTDRTDLLPDHNSKYLTDRTDLLPDHNSKFLADRTDLLPDHNSKFLTDRTDLFLCLKQPSLNHFNWTVQSARNNQKLDGCEHNM